MNRAKSLAEMRGVGLSAMGGRAMDEILASATLSNGRSVHIAMLSRETIVANSADHLGFGGYFVFETCDAAFGHGINILAKALSLDAAFRMIDIWQFRSQAA